MKRKRAAKPGKPRRASVARSTYQPGEEEPEKEMRVDSMSYRAISMSYRAIDALAVRSGSVMWTDLSG